MEEKQFQPDQTTDIEQRVKRPDFLGPQEMWVGFAPETGFQKSTAVKLGELVIYDDEIPID